jgi:hypothetical protein
MPQLRYQRNLPSGFFYLASKPRQFGAIPLNSPTTRRSCIAKGLCTYCKLPGHVSYGCSYTGRCFLCKSPGHLMAGCPQRRDYFFEDASQQAGNLLINARKCILRVTQFN